ncbi:hypothetical protein LTR53_017481, partial [Teratosphaeriaceae sp. CCFEE 6253]
MASTKPPGSMSTQYRSVSNGSDIDQTLEDEVMQPKVELGNHPQLGNRRWLPTIVLQAFFLLWTAPIVTLLVFNLKGYTIGASAWCPGGKCWVDAFAYDSSIPELNVHRFDRQGHNLLGVLQLVAKILEIWFELVAVALVYHYTMRLAAMKEGLPIGYLNRPNEFADLPGLFESLLWSSLPRAKGPQAYNKRSSRWRVWAFIAMTVILCFICNLIGPAIAVLVIPSLQWTKAPQVAYQTFTELGSGNPPSVDGFANGDTFSGSCVPDDFANQRYACTNYDWAEKLDSWTTSWIVAAAESSYTTVTQQDALIFTLNTSKPDAAGDYHGLLYWAPSRQLVSTFSEDRNIVQYIGQGYNATAIGLTDDEFSGYSIYNKSQQLQLQRNGHILRAYATQWYDQYDEYSWTTTVDSERALQCFGYYSYGYTSNNYTKCIQDGAGWGANTKYSTFTIDTTSANVTAPTGNITVEIYSSDQAAFFPNGTLPAGVSSDCLTNGTVPAGTNCDWEAFFRPPSNDMKNATAYVTTLVFTMGNGTNTVKATIDYVTYFGWTLYTLDPYPDSNPLSLVQVQSLPLTGDAVPVDPAWTLAAWSVDNAGTLHTNRSTTTRLHQALSSMLADEDMYADDELTYAWEAVSFVPMLQTLSMIEYTFNASTAKPTKALTEDPHHPLLYRSALMYVWAYGMGSRTAILGVVVAICAVLVVLAQFVLGIVD